MAPIIVAGGGPGGLVAAVALRKVGLPVVVLERSPELRTAGAGLTVQVNALRALDLLGLAAPVRAAGADLLQGVLWDERGRVLQTLPLDASVKVHGMASVAIARPVLSQILAAALPDGVVRFGAAVVDVHQDDQGVDVTLDDGSVVRGAALVGADGLHSAVRTAVWGQIAPRYAGYTCWRGLAPVDTGLPQGHTGEIWGRGRRFGIVPIGPDLTYWFAPLNAPEGGTDGDDPVAVVLEAFGHLGERVRRLVQATPGPDILRNDIVDLAPLQRWSKGRVTLLGDAAHAMTPNMGQGACQAIEDAVVLAASLARTPDDVPAALAAYEAERRPRTTAIQVKSWRIGAVGQWEHPAACWLRNLAARSMPEAAAALAVGALHGVALPSLGAG